MKAVAEGFAFLSAGAFFLYKMLSGYMIANTLAVQLARRHKREIQLRMLRNQRDQLGASVAARADDADGLARHAAASAIGADGPSASVAGRVSQCSAQRAIAAKSCIPYQNIFQRSCLQQPSDSA